MTMTDQEALALVSPALRRDVACPTLFRQAKGVNKHRVSQRGSSVKASYAGATPVEHSSSSRNGDEP